MLKTFQLAILSALVCVFAAQAQTITQQEPQSGQPAQPSSAIYNRMRRAPSPQESGQGQQQAGQNPQAQSPNQQLPQQRRMYFPHPTLPPNQAQPTPSAQTQQPPIQQAPGVQQPNSAQHTPYGLALQAPNPPQISYAQGELTVTANNSSLLEILNGVERTTGAHVEGALADSERVFGRFGPGTPRQVLDALLSGSRYDFILLGSLDDPGDVQRIVLTQRGSAPPTTAQNQPQYRAPEPEEQSDSEPTYQPDISEQPQPAPETTAPANEPQQVKTPEQLLQELQRLRQQQQQQQQQNPH